MKHTWVITGALLLGAAPIAALAGSGDMSTQGDYERSYAGSDYAFMTGYQQPRSCKVSTDDVVVEHQAFNGRTRILALRDRMHTGGCAVRDESYNATHYRVIRDLPFDQRGNWVYL